MKFAKGTYQVSADDETSFNDRMNAFEVSKMHSKTHSLQMVLVTTQGMAKGEHSGVVNHTITLDDMFT